MRILIPVLQFGNSGGFRVLSNLANTWIASGHEVVFMSPIANILPYFPTVAKIIWIDVNGDTCAENMIIEEARYSMFQRWRALYRALNKLNSSFDVVLANHSLSTYPVYFSRIKAKKFYYIQAYEPEYYQSLGGLKSKCLSLFSWFSYYLNLERIVNADLYMRYKNIRAKMVVTPGIDLEIFKPQASDFVDKRGIIGCIGRVESFKGTSYILDAFLLAYKRNPNLKLHIAFGDKSNEKLHPAIKVFMPKSDRELSVFYNSLDILVTAGTVQLGAAHYPVIEGLACGIPVIHTGYYPGTVSNSWIVPIRDAQAIADKIFEISSNQKLKDLKIAKGFSSVDKFSWPLVAQKMYSYFLN
ncbi:MAG TPA: glycosyltransferase family 4 protein [Pedobacter sp.]|uniref:glycosyltransferase family 4 protein n=1 Tax=Pedobacter sp. TaxID=1411316 RepID=UPI002CC392F2|nr:glycosyltransferase family 4 protein [Pedobacter sp.]HMI00857.1 glycosyltransferase family 4 protein [Pedobacter sp.]